MEPGREEAIFRAQSYCGRVRRDILISRRRWHLGSKCVLCLVESDAALIKNIIKMLLGLLFRWYNVTGFHMSYMELSPAIFCFI